MRTSMEEKNKAMSERIAELRSLRTQLSSSFYSRKDKISSSHSQSFTKSPYASFLDGKEGEERERQSSKDGEGMSRKSSKDSLKSHSNRDILIPDAIIVDSDGSEDDGDDNEDIAKVKQGEKAMSTASKGLLPSTPSRSQSIPPTNYLLGRYQASIKLLAESLEEQYNLRAVLDLLLTQPTTTKKHEISSNESKSSNKMLPQTMNELEELLQHDLLHLTSTYYQQTTPLPSNIPSNSSIFTNSQPISSLFSIQDLQENVSNLQKDNNNDENNHGEVSAEFLCNVKYKSLLLQQDKLIAQTVELRTMVEEEKQQRLQIETELKVTKEMLQNALREVDVLQDELHAFQQQQYEGGNSLPLPSSSRSHLHHRNGIASTPPPSGRKKIPQKGYSAPPLSPKASQSSSKTPSNAAPRHPGSSSSKVHQQLPPLPTYEDFEDVEILPTNDEMIAEYEIEPEESVIEMQPRNVDEILAELERDFEDAERLSEAESTHSAQSKTNKSSETSSSIQPKTTFQQLPLAAEFPPLPEDDYTEEDRLSPVPNDANAVPVVDNQLSSSIPEGCIVLDIDIDTNHTDQIIITPDDDPMELASAFMDKHRLPEHYFEPLVSYVSTTQIQLIDSLMRNKDIELSEIDDFLSPEEEREEAVHPEAEEEVVENIPKRGIITMKSEEIKLLPPKPDLQSLSSNAATISALESSPGDGVIDNIHENEQILPSPKKGKVSPSTSSTSALPSQGGPGKILIHRPPSNMVQGNDVHASNPSLAVAEVVTKTPSKQKKTNLLATLARNGVNLNYPPLVVASEVVNKEAENTSPEQLIASEVEIPSSMASEVMKNEEEQELPSSSSLASTKKLGKSVQLPPEVAVEEATPIATKRGSQLDQTMLDQSQFVDEDESLPIDLGNFALDEGVISEEELETTSSLLLPKEPSIYEAGEEDEEADEALVFAPPPLPEEDYYSDCIEIEVDLSEVENDDGSYHDQYNNGYYPDDVMGNGREGGRVSEDEFLSQYESDEGEDEEGFSPQRRAAQIDSSLEEDDFPTDGNQALPEYEGMGVEEEDGYYQDYDENYQADFVNEEDARNHHHHLMATEEIDLSHHGDDEDEPYTSDHHHEIDLVDDNVFEEDDYVMQSNPIQSATKTKEVRVSRRQLPHNSEELYSPPPPPKSSITPSRQSQSMAHHSSPSYNLWGHQTPRHRHQHDHDAEDHQHVDAEEEQPHSPYPVDKTISNEDIGDIIDVAQDVLIKAHELRDDGQISHAIPLYYNALKLLELSEYNDMTAVKEDIDHYLTQQSSEFVKQILQDYEDEVDEERRRDDAGAGEEEEGDGYQEQDGEQEESFYDQLAEVEEQALQEDEYYPEEYVDNEVPPTYDDYNEYNEYPEEFYDEEVGDIEGQDGPLVEEEEEETPPPVENHRKDDRRRYTPTILSEEEEYLSQYEDDEDIGGYLEKGKQLPEEVLIEEFRDRINHGKKNIQPAIQHTEVHAFNSKKIAFHHRGSLLVEDLDML